MGILIRAGQLIDGTGKPPLLDVEVLIENEKIKEIGPKGSLPTEGNEIKDYSNYSIIPGMIDLHTHVCYLTEGKFQKSPTKVNRVDMILRGFKNSRKWLEQGVTTSRVLGTPFDLDIGLKEIIEEEPYLGSRLISAGRMVTMTGGKRTPYDNMKDELTGENNVRRWTRLHMKEGAEVIKLYATTLQEDNVDDYIKRELRQPSGAKDTGRWGSFTVEEINAAVTEAHKVGRTVAAHAAPAFGIKLALKGGVDTVEHGSDLDDECIQLFLETGATLVPTLTVGYHQIENGDKLGLPSHFTEFAQKRWEKNQEKIKQAHAAGVKIGTGTDGFILEDMNFASELELLVEVGLTPLEAIKSSTKVAANCLGLPGEGLGSIEKGNFADLVVLEEDPLKDIASIRKVVAVFKNGELVSQKSTNGGVFNE